MGKREFWLAIVVITLFVGFGIFLVCVGAIGPDSGDVLKAEVGESLVAESQKDWVVSEYGGISGIMVVPSGDEYCICGKMWSENLYSVWRQLEGWEE